MKAPLQSRSFSRPRAAVTADDWGLSRGVNEGILRLASAGVVGRVSILANAGQPEYRLNELLQLARVELGLHLNLTYGSFEHGGSLLRHSGPAGFSLRWLRAGAGARRIVRRECRRQLFRLRSMGVRPRYVDGHHHVHLIPGVIDAIGPVLREYGIKRVRLPVDPGLWRTRRLPVLLLALAARGALERHGFSHRPCFYPRTAHFRDPRRLVVALELLCARHGRLEVISHPAAFNDLEDLDWPDPYRQERVAEFEALLELAPGTAGTGGTSAW